jgi:hypothetical protein
MATANATFYITGVQLEQNTSATPFERRLYNQELANCQRYYYNYSGNNIHGMLYDTAKYIGHAWYPTVMRATPTIAGLSGSYGSVQVISNSNFFFLQTTNNCYLTTYTASAEL